MRRARLIRRCTGAAAGAGLLALVGACGAGKTGEAVRPSDPTAAGALGEAACHDVAGKPGEPLIVDWKPEQRGDLEIAMKGGVAVVSYSCNAIKVLSDCRLEGKYGFMGMTRKEQVVQLQNADEIAVNLPLSGAKLGGELARGSTIDIAMVMIGQRRTTWDAPAAADLKGTCDGATHYVRSATIGAFAVDTGTQGKVRAAAELFSVGADAASSSSKSVKNKDGDVGDCAKATPDSERAPAQCGAPIRLVLRPITPASAASLPPPPPPLKFVSSDEAVACPPGLVYSAGKCTAAATAPSHVCKPGDVSDCTAQCDKGNAGSCGELGAYYANRGGGDEAKAFDALKKGCDGGYAHSCAALGVYYANGLAGKKDPALGFSTFQTACSGGDARGCRGLAKYYEAGTAPAAKDPGRAFALYRQACEGGDATGCATLGVAYRDGVGTDKNPGKAAEYLRRGCDGGDAEGCAATGMMFETGRGMPKNEMLAGFSYQRGCILNNAEACAGAGRIEFMQNSPQAKFSLQRGCVQRDAVACALLKVGYGDPSPVFANVDKTNQWTRDCGGGDARACALVGLVQTASMGPQFGKQNLQRACQMNDNFACAVLKKVP